MSIKRNRPVGNITQQLSDGANRLTKGEPYFMKNFTLKREFDATYGTIGELAQAFSSLVNDLKSKGIIQ